MNNYSLKENVLVLAPAPKKKDYTKTEYKQETKELQILTGILTGITCDNILNNDEVYTLKTWLEGHSELNGNYPFDVAIKSINKALEDNVLEQHELDELLITFKSILDPTSVCSSCKIEFQDKKFCLTGDFISGSKDDIKDIIIKLGGQILTVSSRNLNYLILGGKGSEKYSNGNYGNKYKKAMELNEKGCNIQIINENEFISCIKEVCICG